MKKSRGIQACLGLIDPLTDFCGITVKPVSVCFLFGPRNHLAGHTVKPGCISACFEPRNP